MYNLPDDRGHFGPYGGVFVAETLIHALDELRAAYEKFRNDPEFVAEYERESAYRADAPIPDDVAAYRERRAELIAEL